MATITPLRQQIVLPAAAYDCLEFVALVYGGMGAGPFFDVGYSFGTSQSWDGPRCAHGMAAFASGGENAFTNAIARALFRAGISGGRSDAVVQEINRRHSRVNLWERVPFAEWAATLGVIRGDR